jgi:hypothetical protein
MEALTRIYDAMGVEAPEKLIVQQQGPSPAEQLQMEELQSKTAKNMAGAHKDAAQADKVAAETQLLPAKAILDVSTAKHKDALTAQTATDTLLAPADRLAEAHAQDMEDAHRDKDRDQAKVQAAEKKATETA